MQHVLRFSPSSRFIFGKEKKLTPNEISGIIKTDDGYFEKVKEALEKILPYEVPQIIQVDVATANKSYLDWIKESVQAKH